MREASPRASRAGVVRRVLVSMLATMSRTNALLRNRIGPSFSASTSSDMTCSSGLRSPYSARACSIRSVVRREGTVNCSGVMVSASVAAAGCSPRSNAADMRHSTTLAGVNSR